LRKRDFFFAAAESARGFQESQKTNVEVSVARLRPSEGSRPKWAMQLSPVLARSQDVMIDRSFHGEHADPDLAARADPRRKRFCG
jgi:hypothetical protein